MGGKKGRNTKLSEIQVGEELKITVALTLEKLALNEGQKELEFPSSLTSEERKYIHTVAQKLGYRSKSRGKGSLRYLTVYKKEGSTIMSKEAILLITDGSKSIILNLLQRWPVTNKERQDLLPATEKDRLMNSDLRDLNIVRSLGRLTPGPPQIPALPGHSDVTIEARKLPVWSMKEQLLSAISHNQVILVSGETGSGKTTQIPQIILQEASALGKACRIFCTQPRRISALSIAERVSAERGEKVGYTVGYQIRLEGKFSPKTLLTFCTTGVLLRTLMVGESALATITHIIVDEVHERDRFTDFLLIVLRECLSKFRHLKLILMSANLDVNVYAKYFNNCPIVNIPGKTYPVKAFFLEDVLKITEYKTAKMENAMDQIQKKEKSNKKTAEWMKKIRNESSTTTSTADGSREGSEEKQTNINAVSNDSSSSSDLMAALTEPQKGSDETNKEMDSCLESAFLSGDEEHFSQMLYLILSENVSPDYKHSTTWATPLMIAAGSGRLDVMEQLLALGATVSLKSANDWTATDWANSTSQFEAIELLQLHSACEGINMATLPQGSTSTTANSINEEEQQIVMAYSMSVADDSADTDLAFCLLLKIHIEFPPGGVLVFLPGYEDIVNLRDKILEEDKQFLNGGKYNIFCLHSNMQSSDQKRVFRHNPSGVRKIVLSTNIAETSVTINDIIYVIDCGKLKEMTFDALSGVSSLQAVWVSQASAMQRRGRAGRCQPGICYHLFSKSLMNILPPHQTPEILRTPLQDLCLHTKLLALPNMLIADFLARAPEPPGFIAVKNAVQLLKSMDALDPWEDVTELGHHLLDLPLPPHLGKMVITATILKCLDPVLTIAASLAYKEPFILPRHPADRKKAKLAYKKFAAGTYSDHIVLLKAFQMWQKACSEHWQYNFCTSNFISGATMEMIHGMRAQVLAQLRSSGFVRLKGPGDIRDVNSNSDNWAVIKAALISGMYPQLIRVDRDQNQLRTEKDSKVRIHTSSALIDCDVTAKGGKSLAQAHKDFVKDLPSDWLIYDKLVRIGMMAHVRTVTLVSPLEVLLMAGPMRLPLNALLEPSPNRATGNAGDASSDSENEDRPEGLNCFIILDNWVQFLGDHQTSSLILQLRYKLHSLTLRRLRAPSKPFNQGDEDIIRVIASVLSQEEQRMGLLQPTGIGQRPRPLYSNSPIQDIGIGGLSLEETKGPHVPFSNGGHMSGLPSITTLPPPPHAITVSSPSIKSSNSHKSNTAASNAFKPLESTSKGALIPSTVTVAGGNSQQQTSTSVAVSKNPIMQPKPTSAKNSSNTEVSKSNNLTSNSNSKQVCAQATPGAESSIKNGAGNTTNKHKGVSQGSKARYFIIKVNSYKYIEQSHNRGGVWAFAFQTEKKLVQASQGGAVFLIFALNRGNQFHGYAKFTGKKTEEKGFDANLFGHSTGPLYKIEWLKSFVIHYHQTRHLQNPYTDNLQVHMCRDGQEVEPSIGEKLIHMWDNSIPNSGNNNSNLMMGDMPPLPQRHPMHPHGPPHPPHHPHLGPPFNGGPPHPHGPFQRPFRGYGGAYWGAFGGNYRGGSYRGGYRR